MANHKHDEYIKKSDVLKVLSTIFGLLIMIGGFYVATRVNDVNNVLGYPNSVVALMTIGFFAIELFGLGVIIITIWAIDNENR